MAQRITHMPIIQDVQETDEASLVAAAQRDPAAFGNLYLLYVQPLYRYLFSRIGSTPEAEDATAQTFLAALEAIKRYRHDGHFAAWLFSIARYKAMDTFRQRRNQASLDTADQIPLASDLLQQAIHSERRAALARLIAAMPEEERELIRLRYVADLPFAEIARLLERKEDAVKKTLYRLLARLQSQLEDSNV
jgi:RNA polymerase sigma-70 factor (ECF subfamily)